METGIIASAVSSTAAITGGAIDNTVIGGNTPAAMTGTTVTATGTITGKQGTAAAPSVVCAGFTQTGSFVGATNNRYVIACAGAPQMSFGGSTAAFGSTGSLVWCNTADPDGTVEFGLSRDAAHILAQRALTNAQEFRVYGTTTGPQYTAIKNDGTNGLITTTSTTSLQFGISSGFQWQINAGGHLIPVADVTRDFGTAALRIKTGYFGTSIVNSGFYSTGAPTTVATASYSVLGTDSDVIVNNAGTCTLTLPAAASFTGRLLRVKTITANTVVSASSNTVPLAGGAAGTAILSATAGKWADLKSDGANWIVMAGN